MGVPWLLYVIITHLLFSPAGFGQSMPFGERIRETATPAIDLPPVEPTSDTCEICGQPTLFGRKQCFHCLSQKAPHDFKRWVDDTLDSTRQALQKLRDPALTDEIIERLMKAKQQFQDHKKMDSSYDLAQKRRAIEELGKWKVGSDGRELNDLARERFRKYLPALEGTDYVEDPAKAISYFLILDGKGFIENVKCIRGPLGQPMTLMEAYEYYSRTDPKKAKDMLEIMDNIRKLSSPEAEEESIPLILDSLARSLRILTK